MANFEELVKDLGLGKAFVMFKKKLPDDFTQSFEEWKNHYSREFQDGPRYGQDYRIAILWKLYETSSNYDELNFVRHQLFDQANDEEDLIKAVYTKLFEFSTTLTELCGIYPWLYTDQKKVALGKIRNMLKDDPKVWVKIIKMGHGGELQDIAEKEVMQQT